MMEPPVGLFQVLEEREKLKQERDIRMKKKEYLMKELERLRKQQGEWDQEHLVHAMEVAVMWRQGLECVYSSVRLNCLMCMTVPLLGELLRKKRREKDGHKDPLLQEISHLQEEVMSQISTLRKEHEAAEKKRNEIDKVALILGLSPSDRPLRTSKDQEEPLEKKKQESERSPEGRTAPTSTATKVQTAEEVVFSSSQKA